MIELHVIFQLLLCVLIRMKKKKKGRCFPSFPTIEAVRDLLKILKVIRGGEKDTGETLV